MPLRSTLVLLALWALAGPGSRTVAAAGKPEIEVLPATVELPAPGKDVEIAVVLHNPGDTPLRGVKISWLAADEFAIAPAVAAGPLDVAAHADTAWTLKISRRAAEPVDAGLNLRLDYETQIAGKATAQVLLKSVAVKSREREDTGKLLDVQVKTTLDTLDSYHKGTVYLVVTNKSSGPVTVKAIAPAGPDFVKFDAQELHLPARIDGFQTARFTFQLTADDRVEPGKYLLLFETLVEVSEGGVAQERRIVTAQDVSVGVLGESEILKLVGVPSFLLLPGCLVILTAGLVWSTGLFQPKKDNEKFLLEPTSPYFWVIAVIVSVIMAEVIHLLTGRWYFVRYGLGDMVNIWLLSVAVGAGFYIGLREGIKWYHQRRTPTGKDSPVVILRKLDRQGLGLLLPTAALQENEDLEQAFLLQNDDMTAGALWIGPSMSIDLGKIADAKLREGVRSQMNPEGAPGELADLLKGHEDAIEWNAKPLDRPTLLMRAQFTVQPLPSIVISVK